MKSEIDEFLDRVDQWMKSRWTAAANDRAPSLAGVLAFAIASRIVVLLIACAWPAPVPPEWLASIDVNYAAAHRGFNHRHLAAVAGRPLLDRWYRWDALWYAEISETGYSAPQPGKQGSAAFLPLFPAAIWLATQCGGDRYWAGLLLSNVCFVLGLAAFSRLAFRVTGDSGAAWRACLLLVAYPWSFFYSAPYSESLFFLLSVLGLLAWENRRPASASLWLAFSSAVRLAALAAPFAILAQWAVDRWHGLPTRRGAWWTAASVFFGLLVFAAYLAIRFDDPLLQFRSQAAWNRLSPSLASLWESIQRIILGGGPLETRADAVVALVWLATGIWAWKHRGPFWGVLILVPILQGLASGSIMSMTRFALSAYPAFLIVGEAIRHRVKLVILVACGLAYQAILIAGYVSWAFVG